MEADRFENKSHVPVEKDEKPIPPPKIVGRAPIALAALRIVNGGGNAIGPETDSLDELISRDEGVKEVVVDCKKLSIDLGPVRKRLAPLDGMVMVPGNFYNVLMEYLTCLVFALDLKIKHGTNVTALHVPDMRDCVYAYIRQISAGSEARTKLSLLMLRNKLKTLMGR